MREKGKILVIEDEERMRRLLELVLADAGYQVQGAADGQSGIGIWHRWRPDVVVSDLKMPRMDGLEVLRFRNREFPGVPLVLLTAFGTVDTAVAAMKEGAFDYLTKPVDNNRVLEVVARAMSRCCRAAGHAMVGSPSFLRQLEREIALVAGTDSAVLVTGASGTGKELVARAIHHQYGSPEAPFVRVNCPAIPGDLLESELFGHRRGAFTGAVDHRPGSFVLADGGTLFLDEIGDLPLALQPKLLHAVEEKTVLAVGAARPRKVQVKIVSATNRDLEAMVGEGRFREDLFHRLNILHIRLPPLRERAEDIARLADHFLAGFAARYGRPVAVLDSGALAQMQEYEWPGNIRELRNVLERLVLEGHETIAAHCLPDRIRTGKRQKVSCPGPEAGMDLAAQERALIMDALEKSDWNQSRAARCLGISRNTLRYRIRKHGIRR
ncbi:sigma-54-dependent transcriptional regulator [Thermodesulfobacteriota bacterium B35]